MKGCDQRWVLTIRLRTRIAVKTAGQPDAVANKEAMRIEGTTWMSMCHGSSFVGNLPLALGCFAYQIEGDRLVAMIDSMECVGCLPDVPSEVTPEMGPDVIKAGSQVAIYNLMFPRS